MIPAALNESNASLAPTSLREKLLNVFASPGEVFEEIVAGPPEPANWRAPMLLVCLAGVLLFCAVPTETLTATTIRHVAGAGTISAARAEALSESWPLISSLLVCVSACAGTFWSAFVLWFIGRVFLKSRFSFLKAVEVAGLSTLVLALGTVVTALLILATGDSFARPALSLLTGEFNPASKLHQLLAAMNVFHVWTAAVLSIGLAKISGVPARETALWVFGYWIVLRVAVILLV
ncbi:MAG TPA: YIP1 family protein [Candidatus Angelobacter sp.]|nr:YIP1 family protein [Candidatus Angelobacter sp.]